MRVGDGTPGPGRPKGSKNKNTLALKAMIRAALDAAGGPEYLESQAKANPTAFLTLIGKLLPTEVSGPEGEPITVVEQRIVRPGG